MNGEIIKKQCFRSIICSLGVIYCCLYLNHILAVSTNATEFKWEYHKYIEKICSEYNICPEFVEAIIFYESSWNENAVSKNGQCIGLMQINESVHKQRMKKLGVTNLKDGKQNIKVGVDLLAELFEKYEDVNLVLDAYNGNLKSDNYYLKNQTAYSRRVLNLSAELEEQHGKIGGVG